MLSELIFKQFAIAYSRPTSAITLAPYDDNRDEARLLYTQDLSELSKTPSNEKDEDSESYLITLSSQKPQHLKLFTTSDPSQRSIFEAAHGLNQQSESETGTVF